MVVFVQKGRTPIFYASTSLWYVVILYIRIQGGYNKILTTSDPDFFTNNYSPGKYMPGAPVYHFNGKEIPAMIRWYESGSITSEILVDALKMLDELGIFPCDDGMSPFLLLDGHSS